MVFIWDLHGMKNGTIAEAREIYHPLP
jgi:hypothetical protein